VEKLEKWYLRSYKDGDAHCGPMNQDGTVTGRCGLTFIPERRLFGEGPAFVRPPVDPLQACPSCAAAEPKADPAARPPHRTMTRGSESKHRVEGGFACRRTEPSALTRAPSSPLAAEALGQFWVVFPPQPGLAFRWADCRRGSTIMSIPTPSGYLTHCTPAPEILSGSPSLGCVPGGGAGFGEESPAGGPAVPRDAGIV
jgi:hypothetical protein